MHQRDYLLTAYFADDGALLASTISGAKQAACMYQQASKNFGLTVSISKTKHMVTGRLTENSDRDPIVLEGGDIESVDEFPYLGPVVASTGRMDIDVDTGFKSIEESSIYGQEFKFICEEKVIQCLCPSCVIVWCGMLGHFSKAQ